MAEKHVSDKQAEQAFAEPDEYKGVDVPAESLTPAQTLEREQNHAKAQEELRKHDDKINEELQEQRESVIAQQSPAARYAVASSLENIPVVVGHELVISSADGRVTIDVGGKRAILDSDGAIAAGRALTNAHQAAA